MATTAERSRLSAALLAPHRSYLRAVRPLLDAGLVKGMAHITGGGMTENLPRMLPAGCAARIDRGAWTVPPIFRFLQSRGTIAEEEMFRVFNMGIGFVLVVRSKAVEKIQERLASFDLSAHVIGTVHAGTGPAAVTYEN